MGHASGVWVMPPAQPGPHPKTTVRPDHLKLQPVEGEGSPKEGDPDQDEEETIVHVGWSV